VVEKNLITGASYARPPLLSSLQKQDVSSFLNAQMANKDFNKKPFLQKSDRFF